MLDPTISARPPFAHPPLCVGHPTYVAAPVVPPGLPALPHPTCHPPLHARGHRRDSAPTPSPLQPGYATPPGLYTPPCPHTFPLCVHARGAGGTRGDAHKEKGHVQGEGPHARGGGGSAIEQAGLHMNRRGHTPSLHPLHPVDQLRKIPSIVLVNFCFS